MKYLAILCVIFFFVSAIAIKGFIDRGVEIESLRDEKNKLMDLLEEAQNAEVEANKSIKRLRRVIENSKASMDWYNTPIPADLLDVMQERHNRNRKN